MIIGFGLALVMAWWFFIAWINLDLKSHESHSHVISYTAKDVSFLIAARNEEDNIFNCLKAISNEVGNETTNVILVNDHSTDLTLEKAQAAALTCSNINLKIIQNAGHGKKAALVSGLKLIDSPLVYLIDADCLLQAGSLVAMLESASEESVSAVQGTVVYAQVDLLSQVIQVENLNNMAVTESMLQKKLPGFGNAGNLLFKNSVRDLFEKSLIQDLASGDDVFFIHSLLKLRKKIVFQRKSTVRTAAQETLLALIHQRLRWAKKGLLIKHPLVRWLPSFVFLIHFLLILFTVYTIAIDLFYWSLVAWILKFGIEVSYHKSWFLLYGQKHKIAPDVLTSFLYPIYVIAIGFLAAINVKFSWKGRKFEV